ncbi:WecB/TagA/CpsF family glycosyltransferase [Solimonas flava]|uniref:WecB/TagA/CpsF family glycosyltransferase n=1 Tax=Solimonas flava TaxID=415849 RepID=UPI00041AEA46|nr:WecB/TagA/CpsF family glycosyltransferase [Solimonas flava]
MGGFDLSGVSVPAAPPRVRTQAWRRRLRQLLPLWDLLLLLAAAPLATAIASALGANLPAVSGWPDWERWALPLVALGPILLYQPLDRPPPPLRGFGARLLLFVAIAAAAAALAGPLVPGVWLLAWLALVVAGLSGLRLLMRRLRGRQTLAIYGAGPETDRLVQQLRRQAGDRIELLGVFDDRMTRASPAQTPARGGLVELARLAQQRPVDWTLVSVPESAQQRIQQLLPLLRGISDAVALSPAPAPARREGLLAESLKVRMLADAEHTACDLDDYDLSRFIEVARGFGQDAYTYVVTPNVDHLIRLHDDVRFRALYEDAGYVLLDSRFLSHLLHFTRGVRLPVCAGSDLTGRLFGEVIAADDGLVLIGGSDAQAAMLRERYGLRRFAHHNPPMGFIRDPGAVERCLSFIEAHSPFRFCLLAVGSPQQEIIARELQRRGKARGMALCVGASIDFLTGGERRAPAWMQRAGVEWLYRLMQAPRRMARRYLVRGPRVFSLLTQTEVQLRMHA